VLVETLKSCQSSPVPLDESNENFLSEIFEELRDRTRIDINGPILFVTVGTIDHLPDVPMEPANELEPYRVFGIRSDQTGYQLSVWNILFHDLADAPQFKHFIIP
jgi:hypothetical protein